MRIFEISGSRVTEHDALAPMAVPGACANGYLWISLTRDEFRSSLAEVQGILQSLCGTQLVDLHVSDLLNDQLPSHYDYTSQYDVLVFRRLAAANGAAREERRTGAGTRRPAGAAARRHAAGRLCGLRPRAAVGASGGRRGARRLRRPAAGRGGAGRSRGRRRRSTCAPSPRACRQPGRPDAARGQPDRRRLPRPAARPDAAARPLAGRADRSRAAASRTGAR